MGSSSFVCNTCLQHLHSTQISLLRTLYGQDPKLPPGTISIIQKPRFNGGHTYNRKFRFYNILHDVTSSYLNNVRNASRIRGDRRSHRMKAIKSALLANSLSKLQRIFITSLDRTVLSNEENKREHLPASTSFERVHYGEAFDPAEDLFSCNACRRYSDEGGRASCDRKP